MAMKIIATVIAWVLAVELLIAFMMGATKRRIR